jgi:hypothetical protein
MRHEFPLHRIGMHVFQLFSAFSCAPDVEIVEAALPELAERRIFVSEPQPQLLRGVPLDENEGVVKAEFSRAVFLAPRRRQRLEDEELWKSHGESLLGGIVPPTIDTA